MASLNKAQIIGNLGRDPELRYLPDGKAVVNLAIATSEKYKDKSGQQVEHTEWHKVSFFDKLAEICGQYLKKGSTVYVEGSIRTRKYMDKDGVEKYSTEIRGERMQMLGGKPEGSTSAKKEDYRAASGSSGFDDIDSDLPF